MNACRKDQPFVIRPKSRGRDSLSYDIGGGEGMGPASPAQGSIEDAPREGSSRDIGMMHPNPMQIFFC